MLRGFGKLAGTYGPSIARGIGGIGMGNAFAKAFRKRINTKKGKRKFTGDPEGRRSKQPRMVNRRIVTAGVGEYVDNIPAYIHMRKSRMRKLLSSSNNLYPNLTLRGFRTQTLECPEGFQVCATFYMDKRSDIINKYKQATNLKSNVDGVLHNTETNNSANGQYGALTTLDDNTNRYFIDEGEGRTYEIVNNNTLEVKVIVIDFKYKIDADRELGEEFMRDANILNPLGGNYSADNMYHRANIIDTAGTLGSSCTTVQNLLRDYNNNQMFTKCGKVIGVRPWNVKQCKHMVNFVRSATRVLQPGGKLTHYVATKGRRVYDTPSIDSDNTCEYKKGMTRGVMFIIHGQVVSNALTTAAVPDLTYSRSKIDIVEKITSKVRPCKYMPNQNGTFNGTGTTSLFSSDNNVISGYSRVGGQFVSDATTNYGVQASDGDVIENTQVLR